MKKNNTAEKAILDAEKTAKAIKEHTEKSLRDLMAEAINNIVKESAEDFEEDEDSYEEEDVDTEETPATDEVTPEIEGGEDATELDGEEADGEADAEGDGEADDEWADMEQYKVGDNDYDFTGVNGEEILKVFNKLGDDDKILVTKNDDGDYEFKDDETGAEYVIELDPDALPADDDTEDVDANFDGEDDEVELDFDDETEGAEDEFDTDINDDMGEDEFEADEDDEFELDINDDEDELNEDLGYTDSYQKDVFGKKFNMSEPAKSKETNDWDGGAPKGNAKPWAGKGDSAPFDKKVNEDEMLDGEVSDEPIEETKTLRKSNLSKKTMHAPKGHKEYMNKGSQNVVDGTEQVGNLNESIAKIIKKAKEIQKVNEQYQAVVKQLKNALQEAAISTVTLANMNKILTECTMTIEERRNLAQRFINVKTLAESKSVYETVKRELNEASKSTPIVEHQLGAESSKTLNETVVYQTPENNPSLSLMERMDNLKKWY